MAKVRLAAAAAGTSGVGPWYVGPCRECSTSFATKQPHAEWCSDICQRRFMRRHGSQSLSSNRKRARYYGCEYEPIRRPDVYERDAWVCGICSLPTTPHATVPDWNAPTIDHVVPMSLGGGHTYENVQCAHFICNTRKGIKLLTDVA